MKRILLTSVLVSFGLAFGLGCAVDDSVPVSQPASSGGDNTTGSGGGQNTTGGGQDMTGGGQNTTGGGQNNTGMGGMAGAGTGGMAGGGVGGATNGGGGMGGAGGAMGTDVIGEGKSDYGYAWKDSWWISGCQVKAGHDCITINNCPNGGAANFEDRGAVEKETFPIGGTKGKTYTVTFQINGISEGKYYSGGTPDLTTVPAGINSMDLDTFQIGGTAVVSNYNVIKLTVFDGDPNAAASTAKEVDHYYFNSFPQASGAESHRTFHLSYSKSIDVPGGGYVQYLAEDSNCHAIDNCGDGDVSDTVCNAARGIPHEEANPLPPTGIDPSTHKSVALATLNSVNGSQKPWHSQIIHLTITKTVAK
jgi:hypothetical protein